MADRVRGPWLLLGSVGLVSVGNVWVSEKRRLLSSSAVAARIALQVFLTGLDISRPILYMTQA